MGVRQSAWNFDRAVTWGGRAGHPVPVEWYGGSVRLANASAELEDATSSAVAVVPLKTKAGLPSWFKHLRATADHATRCIALKRFLRSHACPLSAAVLMARQARAGSPAHAALFDILVDPRHRGSTIGIAANAAKTDAADAGMDELLRRVASTTSTKVRAICLRTGTHSALCWPPFSKTMAAAVARVARAAEQK